MFKAKCTHPVRKRFYLHKTTLLERVEHYVSIIDQWCEKHILKIGGVLAMATIILAIMEAQAL